MFNRFTLPKYDTLEQYEGRGNYALKKYYQFPYSFFYKHKLKMIVNLMHEKYKNILDFGCGPGIFTPELKRHAFFVIGFEKGDPINPLWKFDCIVCASVLDFCELEPTLITLKRLLNPKGVLLIASPMKNKITSLYLKENVRHHHDKILSAVSKVFKLREYHTWLGLYFSIRATND